jgi:hypothetical protein
LAREKPSPGEGWVYPQTDILPIHGTWYIQNHLQEILEGTLLKSLERVIQYAKQVVLPILVDWILN